MGDDIVPAGHRVWSLKVAPDKSFWVVSTRDNFPPLGQSPQVHRSADEGLTWTTTEIPAAMNTYGWDISPVDSNIAYVALDTAGLYRTIDGGQSWNEVEAFPNDRAGMVHFFNENDGWVYALDSAVTYLIMTVTSDGGATWTEIGGADWTQPAGTSLPELDLTESVPGYTFSINSAYDYTDESIMIGTAKGTYWRSDDRGYNWKRYETPLVDLGLLASNIAMKDTSTFLVAGDISSSGTGGTTAKSFSTTDGGDTWMEGEPGMTVGASHYIPESDSVFIMVGHNNFGWGDQGTAITYDYGVTWEFIDNVSLLAVDFIDQNTGIAACCNNSWSTANGQIHKWNFELPTATKEVVISSKIKVSPNPVADFLTIEIGEQLGGNNLNFEIISLDGRIIKTWKSIVMEKIEIGVHDLPIGFYVLKIEGIDKIISKKIIKE